MHYEITRKYCTLDNEWQFGIVFHGGNNHYNQWTWFHLGRLLGDQWEMIYPYTIETTKPIKSIPYRSSGEETAKAIVGFINKVLFQGNAKPIGHSFTINNIINEN